VSRTRTAKDARGYFGVAAWRPKTQDNVGTLWRSAHIFGAAFLATVGARYRKQPSDTLASYRHVPLFSFVDPADFWDHIPHDCRPVAVEIDSRAKPVGDFVHPQRAVYILGPEDGNLPGLILDRAWAVVQLPGEFCLNLAVAGSLIMYDRINKQR